MREAVIRLKLTAERVGKELARKVFGNVVPVQFQQQRLHFAWRFKRLVVEHFARFYDRRHVGIVRAPFAELREVLQAQPQRVDLFVAGMAHGL